MKSINALVAASIFFIGTTAFSQPSTIQLYVTPTFGDSVINLANSAFKVEDASNLQIEVLKFYISNIRFLKNGKVVLSEENSFHLIDAEDETSQKISIVNHQNIDYDEVGYSLGIDSATNVSGALGGDLDPTKGMYWAWQSGYINFKLEGRSSYCRTRNNEFSFHLGGYQQPGYCLQNLSFPTDGPGVIHLKLDVRRILSRIDLAKTDHIMSPSEEAVLISQIVASSFSATD